ncbi:MAG: VOC family protein [Bacteroidota bacterium]
MTKNIFVNLPVKDLKKSMDFYAALGFSNNPQFSDESGACMVISENIYVMLLTYGKFKGFTKKEIADATKTTQVLLCIDAESKEKVIELVNTAKNSGGSTYMDASDHGWMYQHSFADIDGHQWEVAYMDLSKFPQQ